MHRHRPILSVFGRTPEILEQSPIATPIHLDGSRPPSLDDTRLATLPFLSAEDAVLVRGCALMRRSVRAGMEFREGDLTDSLHFIEQGWACQYSITRDGRRQISALLLPGDVCNLDALLFTRLDCGVRMLTAGTVLSVPRERVAALAATSPGIGQCFSWLSFVENAVLSRHTLCLGRLTARERLAHLFCEIGVRLGVDHDEGEVSFDMPLTQEVLADMLGLTPVHLNRTIQQLRAEGLLSLARRTIVIHDVAALRCVGEFDPSYLHIAEAQEATSAASLDRRVGARAQ